MKVMEKVSWLMGRVQENLFPHLNQCLKTSLTAQEERLVSILEIIQVERHVPKAVSRYRWPGRNAHDRQSLARAFVAKALYRHPTTSDLIRALNSAENLRRIFGHISRDSTAIVGREKPAKKEVKEPKTPRKRGRPAKGEQREPAEEKRLDRQVEQSAEEAIKELPVLCDRGTKKNAKGYKTSWNGYKLHLDTNDTGLPISALVTSASLHDSQAAIPLIKLTSRKVTYLYDLMDAAYDAKRIDETSRQLGHVPITEKNGRGQEVIPMAPHEAERYKIRSGAERANSRLKEDFGANNVMVKGHSKVTQHLMFGVIALFADQLLRLLG